MFLIKKFLIPLFEGNLKQGYLHIAIVDQKGYSKMIEFVDENDSVSNDLTNWPEWKEFAGLAYDRKTVKGPKDWWMILPLDNKDSKITINTLSHEALHITRMIYDSRGVLFDPNNDEPFAYMVGWVTQMAFDAVPKKYMQLATKKESEAKAVTTKEKVVSNKTKVKKTRRRNGKSTKYKNKHKIVFQTVS